MPISIRTGDAMALLRAMPSDSVHCCVTSPPYWGLRDYGTPPQIWGGDPDCRHRWGAFCQRCGAWRGSLGLEPTYQLYVDHLVEVLREIRRILRPDGTLWLNLGDCYATGGGKAKKAGGRGQGDRWEQYGPSAARAQVPDGKNPAACIPTFQPNRMPQPGLKPKDLVGIPWRVAFALQDDGWWLRRDQIWAKPNPMPESTTDRCTSAHEYLFHLTKSGRYYFDHHAIKEPFADERNGNPGRYSKTPARSKGATREQQDGGFLNNGGGWNADGSAGGRHKRSVWTIATSPFPEAHFATFPPALVEPCILAGTSERGVCSHCGAPWRRLVRKRTENRSNAAKAGTVIDGKGHPSSQVRDGHDIRNGPTSISVTIGWRASCDCPGTDAVPAIVLDPFLGSGTTALVARRLGRDCIGLELSPAYAAMARRRTRAPEPQLRRAA